MGRLRTFTTCVFAAVVRFLLFSSERITQLISERNEVSTPLNNWKRVIEGVEIHKLRFPPGSDSRVSPYDGDVYHETPFALVFFRLFARENTSSAMYLFIFCDVLTGMLLAWSSNEVNKFLLRKQVAEVKIYATSSVDNVVKRDNIVHLPYFVLLVYLFNPFTIASCVAQTTTVFTNLLLALTLLTMLKGCHKLSTLFLSLVTYQSMYPVVLLAPVMLHKLQHKNPKQSPVSSCIWTCVSFLVWISAIMYLSSWIMSGSWGFLHSVYGFIFYVTDTAPNMGLFWYFFTEMFDHFTHFFLWVFQLNAFVYVLPLAIRFRWDCPYLFLLLLCQITICKSYPCVGDVALYMALIPMHSHIIPHMRNRLVSGMLMTCSAVIGPIMYHLWIYSGSANANFYFAVTLAFNTGQVFLLSDLMTAYLRREHYVRYGKQVDVDGQPVPIYLQ